MSDFTPKKLLIFFLLALLIYGQFKLWFGNYGVVKLATLKKELVLQKQENQTLIERNEALNAQVKELVTAKETLEERARSQLGMIKRGEIFIQETQNSEKK